MGASKVDREIYIDFEFNEIVEPKVNLVCAATFDPQTGEKKKWWLHNKPEKKNLLYNYLKKFNLIISYAAVAECRSFLSLGLNPLKFQMIDLFLEWRMLTNHNDELQWGKQLKDGRVVSARKPRPKWERTEGENDGEEGFKATHSLAEATYKLTGEIRDTEHKTEMRNLIISAPKKFKKIQRRKIMEYCLEDVVFLPAMRKKMESEFTKLDENTPIDVYREEAKVRGRYSAHTALMESDGYPIDIEKTKNFSKQVGIILLDLQREINGLFPDIKPFKWNRALNRYSWDTKATKNWIEENHDAEKWMKTDGGALSLALEAFERNYAFKHDYPKDNFGAQMVRFLKLKQSLYGFSDTGGKRKNFWDSVGSDGRVRPYMNHFGAQSSRSQPGASGFMFLKPAWMRALVIPEKGKFMAGVDYGQQEFFVAGLESGDERMIEAYLSGDPYLYGAKLAGAIPQNGTKESHPTERDLYKNTYLGIQYGMTKYGLAIKLTNDLGREVTEDEAQEQIDIFEDTFPDYMTWKREIGDAYIDGGGIILPCGWRMFGDNDNIRSVYNVPVQGFGASVMRKAVDLAVEKSCQISFTLHDALYIEGNVGEEYKIKWLADAMREAFVFYVDKKYRKEAQRIKLDPFAWSRNYKKDSTMNIEGMKVPCSNLYVDERSIVDYNRFSKYFEKPDTDYL